MNAIGSSSQLVLELPDDAHPLTVARRERRERAPPDDAGVLRALLAARHREEWDLHLDVWHDALFKRSEPLAKLAKSLAETLRIRQADERALLGGEPTATEMDPETRRRRILELLKELGIGT